VRAGDTITVDGTTFHFVNTGSVTGTSVFQYDISDSVGTLLSKIGSVTGSADPLWRRDQLNLGTGQDLTSPLRRRRRPRSQHSPAASGTVTWARTAGPPGTGIVMVTISGRSEESISARVTGLQRRRTPVNRKCAGQVDSTRSVAHQDTWNLFIKRSRRTVQIPLDQRWHQLHFGANGALISPQVRRSR